VKSLICKHDIDCDLRPGVAGACLSARDMAEAHAYSDHLVQHYGYAALQKLDRDQMRALCPSPVYHGGVLDRGAAHLYPLRYALGLARAARAAGARLHERSEVPQIIPVVCPTLCTAAGKIIADHVILACNGYRGGLNRKVARHVMPINNFIAATTPLGDAAARV